MKILFKIGKIIFLYIDTQRNNKVLLSIIDSNTFKNIKKKNYIKIVQSKLEGNIELDNFVSINNAILSSQISKIIIKNFCSIAPNVSIIGHLHNYKRITSYYIFSNFFKEFPNNDTITKGDIIIEEDVWIGAGAVILSGITIGRGSIIGANSVCNKPIERYSIVAGAPSKVLNKRFSESKIKEIEESCWWKWSRYELTKNKVLFNREE
ncbi:MAG: CatB-related O-acetyltransferase [Cetobacterium sp.]